MIAVLNGTGVVEPVLNGAETKREALFDKPAVQFPVQRNSRATTTAEPAHEVALLRQWSARVRLHPSSSE